jgi:hypothetical protein
VILPRAGYFMRSSSLFRRSLFTVSLVLLSLLAGSTLARGATLGGTTGGSGPPPKHNFTRGVKPVFVPSATKAPNATGIFPGREATAIDPMPSP